MCNQAGEPAGTISTASVSHTVFSYRWSQFLMSVSMIGGELHLCVPACKDPNEQIPVIEQALVRVSCDGFLGSLAFY